MEYRLLGPFEVTNADAPVDIGPRQQRTLLALLLVNLNRVVSTERIIEQIWPDEPNGKERTLWVYISRLRTALEPGREANAKSSVLVTGDHGYSLRAAPGDVDFLRFEELATQGNGLLAGHPDQAGDVLRMGLDLWRGTALEDFAYDEFAQPVAARLEELRLEAIENRIDADIRTGGHRDALGDLEQLVREHPYRERLVSLQMLALYRSGRQADALRAFEHHRRTIAEELGLEPSPELRRVEEHVLLHDERLGTPVSTVLEDESIGAPNPFKGLQAFGEADVGAFFGRDRLLTDLIRRAASGSRLVALVGAGGSGKSSVLHAGFVPAIRKGAVSGSEHWLIAKMTPGSRPFREIEAALLRSTLDAPDGLAELLDDPEDGLLRACLRLLSDENERILIVIDQFEELFTLSQEAGDVDRFIRNLEVVLNDPYGRVLLAIGLRADFYGGPLEYPHFAQLLGDGIVNVGPLLPDELEAAAEEPTARAGAQLETALTVQLLADVAGQVGALPLFQYALTELFDRRSGSVLTLEAYRQMSGVSGALARRAEDLFLGLEESGRVAAKQLFLRLVTISEQGTWSRRRVEASEVVSIMVDVVALQPVLDRFAAHRLVTFDRDPVSGSPTVEVAHEALLDKWPRLREWIDDGQRDVRRHAALVIALLEWRSSGEQDDYLLVGGRLADYESWAAVSTLRLTADEERYLDVSILNREIELVAEEQRVVREHRVDRRARRRLWGLIPSVLAIAAIAIGMFFVLLRDDDPSIAVVHAGSGDLGVSDMMIQGVGASERDRDITVDLVQPLVDPEAELRDLAVSGADLIVVGSQFDMYVERVAPDFPDVHWVAIDPVALHIERSNISEVHFAVEDAAFVAGVAAALSTRTGRVGFIGGVQSFRTESSRNGFEQGVVFEEREVEIVSVFVGPTANPLTDTETRTELAYELAVSMYSDGVDVIFHDAGEAGAGVLRAAREYTNSARRLWTIGSDVDEYLTVSDTDRQHVLTSTIKRYDTAVESAIAAFLDGDLAPGDAMLGLRDGGVEVSRSGDHMNDFNGYLRNVEGEIEFGHLPVSALASKEPGWQTAPDVTVSLVLSDDGCEVDDVDGATLVEGELRVQRGSVIRFRLTNESDHVGGVAISTIPTGVTLATLRQEAEIGIPASFDALLAITRAELGATTAAAVMVTGSRLVPNCLLEGTDTQPANFPALIVRSRS